MLTARDLLAICFLLFWQEARTADFLSNPGSIRVASSKETFCKTLPQLKARQQSSCARFEGSYYCFHEAKGNNDELMCCDLQVPIIAPVKQKNFQVQQPAGVTNYKAEFLTGLMSSPALIRNVAIAGHLHHGKTVVSPLCTSYTLA